MYDFKIDAGKNRLYIKLSGYFEYEEMKKCSDETIKMIEKLKPGYDVITDISEFKPVSPEATKEIERVQAYFVKTGVRKGVRVVGEKILSGMQFKRKGKDAGYDSTNVATLADAEKLLDSQGNDE